MFVSVFAVFNYSKSANLGWQMDYRIFVSISGTFKTFGTSGTSGGKGAAQCGNTEAIQKHTLAETTMT